MAGVTTADPFDAGLADLLRTTHEDGTVNDTYFEATVHA